jgi:hypothetical protein
LTAASPISISTIKGKDKIPESWDDRPLGPTVVDLDNLSTGSITPRQTDFLNDINWTDF